MSEELKPCPFCNCEMEIETVGRSWWRIKPVDGHDDLCPFGEEHEWDCSQSVSKQVHIDDWNNQTVVNGAQDKITQLEKDNAELVSLVEKAFIEGCSTGYSEGLNDGQTWSSNKCSLDKDEEWKSSESKELLERMK